MIHWRTFHVIMAFVAGLNIGVAFVPPHDASSWICYMTGCVLVIGLWRFAWREVDRA